MRRAQPSSLLNVFPGLRVLLGLLLLLCRLLPRLLCAFILTSPLINADVPRAQFLDLFSSCLSKCHPAISPAQRVPGLQTPMNSCLSTLPGRPTGSSNLTSAKPRPPSSPSPAPPTDFLIPGNGSSILPSSQSRGPVMSGSCLASPLTFDVSSTKREKVFQVQVLLCAHLPCFISHLGDSNSLLWEFPLCPSRIFLTD